VKDKDEIELDRAAFAAARKRQESIHRAGVGIDDEDIIECANAIYIAEMNIALSACPGEAARRLARWNRENERQ
jgi:hypothetical protein